MTVGEQAAETKPQTTIAGPPSRIWRQNMVMCGATMRLCKSGCQKKALVNCSCRSGHIHSLLRQSYYYSMDGHDTFSRDIPRNDTRVFYEK